MSQRQDRKLQEAKRNALLGYALNFELEPDGDYFRAGNNPPEHAFQLLSCGLDMSLAFIDKAFPSFDRGTLKKGRKWAREAIAWSGGNSGGFMARAVPTLLARTHGRVGDDADDSVEAITDPDFHLSMRKSVEDFFPRLRHSAAEGDIKSLVEQCDAEFAVIDKGGPREAVAEGEEPASEYSLALMRGEDPSQDGELLEAQRLYARDYFIHRAALAAAQTLMFLADVKRLWPKLIVVFDPNEPRMSEYRQQALAAWVEASRPYREYALLADQRAGSSENQRRTGTS